MKPITKQYLKSFLLTAIPYGLIMLGFDLLDGNELNFFRLIFTSIVFGTFMSFTFAITHKYRLKEKQSTKTNLQKIRVSIYKE